MKKYSETSLMILKSNNINFNEDDAVNSVGRKDKEFVKQLRLTLRLDYEYPATEVRKMNDNKVIETWFEEHKKEKIGGSW